MSSVSPTRSTPSIDTIQEQNGLASTIGSLFRRKNRPSVGDLKILYGDEQNVNPTNTDACLEQNGLGNSMGSLFRRKQRPSVGDLKLLSSDEQHMSPTIQEMDQISIQEEEEEFDLLSILNSATPVNKSMPGGLNGRNGSNTGLPTKSKFKMSSDSICKTKDDIFAGYLRVDGKECYCRVDTSMIVLDSIFNLP
jgi:hypothetical protein